MFSYHAVALSGLPHPPERPREPLPDLAGSAELPAVRAELEALVGGSVSRALAARVLGVSQTGLDKRIARGDVPVVVTVSGRREVPVAALVALADDAGRELPGRGSPDDAGRELPGRGSRSALGAVLDRRRAAALALDPEDLLPASYLPGRDTHPHRRAELLSLAYHRAVAGKLDPVVIADARQRLSRWREQERIHAHYADAWELLLRQPAPAIADAICADDQRGRDLRQNSPFAGALSEPERQRAAAAIAR